MNLESRCREEEIEVVRKQTSKRAASAASDVLRDKRTSKKSKTAAGSALSQRETSKQKGR